MARPGQDAVNSEKYIQLPKLNVSYLAETFGFTSKVSFPDKNVVKFYKVMQLKNKVFRYASRNCAKQNGRLVSAYDQSTMQTLFETLKLEEDFLLAGLTKRSHLLTNFRPDDGKKSWVYENGLAIHEQDQIASCPFWSSEGQFEKFAVYDVKNGKLTALSEEYVLKSMSINKR